MNPVIEEAIIRAGGVEAFTEAVNTRIRENEARQGIPAERSRAGMHPATVRAWRRGARPRYAVVLLAVCELTGRNTSEIGPADTFDDVDRREFLTHAVGGLGAAALAGGGPPALA